MDPVAVDAAVVGLGEPGVNRSSSTRRLEGFLMPRERHVPIRMCLICGERRPKSQLLRIVRTSDRSAKIEEGERINGRGCYICPDSEKFDVRKINGKIKRALKLAGDIPPELIASLETRSKST